MKRILATTAMVTLATLSPLAYAQEDACDAAFQDAQALQNEKSLIDAKNKFKLCSPTSCSNVFKACTRLLAEVEKAIPTVVFSVKNAQGQDLHGAQVMLGAKTLTTSIDERAIEVDPGSATFVFVLKDGRRRELTVVIRELEKGQRVSLTIEDQPSPAPLAAPLSQPDAKVASGAKAPPDTSTASNTESHPGGSGLRMLGWGVAGAGVLGLGLGTVFGVKAMGSKNDAHCKATNVCESGPLADARSAATISTVGFVAGAALLAGGIALVLLGPPASSATATRRRLEAAPVLAHNQGGLLLRGAW